MSDLPSRLARTLRAVIPLAFLPLCGVQGQVGSPTRPVTVALGAMLGFNGWFTSDDDDSEAGVGHAIDYHVAGVRVLEAGGTLFVDGIRFAGLSARTNVGRASGSRPVTSTGVETSRSHSGFDASVDLTFLATTPGVGTALLSGLRIAFHRAVFDGPATAVETTTLIDRDGATSPLAVGDVFAVDARFDDWYLGLFRFGDPRGINVRLGAYRSVLDKPHEAMVHPFGSGAAVVATRMTGHGGFASMTSSQFHMLYRFGTVDFEPRSGRDVVGLYEGPRGFGGLIQLDWRPRIGLGGGNLSLVPRIGLMLRGDFLDSPTETLSADDSELSLDIHADVGVGIVWSRF